MTFTGLFDLFKGLFSRAFWFGSFLPLAIFGAANLVFAGVVFPGRVNFEDWKKPGDAPFSDLAIAFAVLVVLAYAVAPLIPLMRGVFDGSLLPGAIHNYLRDQRTGEARRIRAARRAAFEAFNAFEAMLSTDADSQTSKLDLAYTDGEAIQGPAPPDAVRDCVAAVESLERALDDGRALTPTEVERASAQLASFLGAGVSRERDPLFERMIQVIKDAHSDAQHRWRTLVARHGGLALSDPQATQIGDARALVQSYASDVYGVDFDYVWPRLQLVLPKDSPLNDRIVMAQGQVDFAVLMLTLSLAFSIIWLTVLAVVVASPWPLLVLGAGMPLLVLFFYQLLFESEIAFGDVVKLVIDQYRLDLLTKVLRQPMPATLFAERRLWQGLVQAEIRGTGVDLTYRHPPAGASG